MTRGAILSKSVWGLVFFWQGFASFLFGFFTPENNWTKGGYFVEVFLEGLFFLAGLRLVFYLDRSLLKRFEVLDSAHTGYSRGSY